MSARSLGAGRGTAVSCNGHGCAVKSTTGQIYKKDHRAYLKSQGWGRGSVSGTKTRASTKCHDLCPPCLTKDREAAEKIRKERDKQIAARDAGRIARAARKAA